MEPSINKMKKIGKVLFILAVCYIGFLLNYAIGMQLHMHIKYMMDGILLDIMLLAAINAIIIGCIKLLINKK